MYDNPIYQTQVAARSLRQMLVAVAVLIAVIFIQGAFLADFYLDERQGMTGYLINASIAGLFVFGLIRVALLFRFYDGEEGAIDAFVQRFVKGVDNPTQGIHDTIIGRRFKDTQDLYKRQAAIDQGALSAVLTAQQSNLTALPRFIHSILILAGMFGTILGLAVALTGAGDLLNAAGDIEGIKTVISGMSAALSTTLTAIVAYLFFSYFTSRLSDVQTNVMERVERVTTMYLVPKFDTASGSVEEESGRLLKDMKTVVRQMQEAHEQLQEIHKTMFEVVQTGHLQVGEMAHEMNDLKHILKRGFRLGEDE